MVHQHRTHHSLRRVGNDLPGRRFVVPGVAVESVVASTLGLEVLIADSAVAMVFLVLRLGSKMADALFAECQHLVLTGIGKWFLEAEGS